MRERIFETYRLVQKLGGGGMGTVYHARTADGRDVALKLVEIGAAPDSRDVAAAERVGAQLQQQFGAHDPRVPKVFRFGEAEEHFFIEMELVRGRDLAERIAQGLEPVEAARIGVELADFIHEAHKFTTVIEGREFHGIVHGDLKPKNIRLSPEEGVKILDFGIAKGLSLTGRLATVHFGSPSYMSPEWLETGRVDRQVDFWSLGVVLFEMLAGQPPFRGETPRQLELAVRSGRPTTELPGACPEPLGRITLKALAARPERRYQSAAEFKADLVAWLEGRPTLAAREPAPEIDNEATRRTQPSLGEADTEPTRRTHAVETPAAVMADTAGRPEVPAAAAPARLRGRFRRIAVRVAVILFLVGLANEAVVWSAADELRRGLATRQQEDLTTVWEKYEALSGRSLLGLGTVPVRGPLKETLLAHADRVIADYRLQVPTVREAQWRMAQTWLGQALSLDPGDGGTLARLRYAEGHLLRITGEVRIRQRQLLAAPKFLHDAVARFEEAAELEREWPDPYLGLLRTYVYGLGQPDSAAAALRELERRGYAAGRREFAQLGDGYRASADTMLRECGQLPGSAMERPCLERSAEQYRKAIDWYGKAIGFGDARSRGAQAEVALAAIHDRLERMDESARGRSKLESIVDFLGRIFR